MFSNTIRCVGSRILNKININCTSYAQLNFITRLYSSSNFPAQIATSVELLQGRRPYMEDFAHTSDDNKFFLVCDGHGGHRVAEYVQQNLPKTFYSLLPEKASLEECKEVIDKAFQHVDDELIKNKFAEYEGCAAAMIYIHETEGKKYIISANLGDSRAVLFRDNEASELTEDHKPNSPSERSRIEKLGGVVTCYAKGKKTGFPIDRLGVWRVNHNLALSRAFGDTTERPYVSNKPDIRHFELERGHTQFIVLATDGLWDILTNDDIIKQVDNWMVSPNTLTDEIVDDVIHQTNRDSEQNRKKLNIYSRCKTLPWSLISESYRLGSSDNITVIVHWIDLSYGNDF